MANISYRNRNKGKTNADGRALKANWEYRFYGAPIRSKRQVIQKCGFSTKAEAIEAGTKAYTEYMQVGSVFSPTEMSYSDCLDSWLDNYVAVNCKDTTREGYEKRVEQHIRPTLGKYRLAAIQTEHIQKFINSLYYKRYSRNTLSNLLGIISNSMKYAKRQKWIQHSPTEDVLLPSTRKCQNQRHMERNAISRKDLDAIFTRFPEGHSCHLPMMLAYHCGLRLGEVFGLIWEDIDLQEGKLTVNRQVQWMQNISRWLITEPKYESTRTIALDNTIWSLLRREHTRQLQNRLRLGPGYRRYYEDKDHLLSETGTKELHLVTLRPDGSYVQARATQHSNHVIKTELGIENFDFHSLRHTHATELSEFGVNPKEIQRRLGHKSLEVTTRRYIHATEEMQRQSVEIMNQMYQAR